MDVKLVVEVKRWLEMGDFFGSILLMFLFLDSKVRDDLFFGFIDVVIFR